METPKDDYLTASRGLKLSRDAEGVLVDHLHTNGGPSTFTAEDHTEFVDAFYRITQDRANQIVMLTCAGGEFSPDIDFACFGNVTDPGVWSQVHDEGVQIVENIANIRVDHSEIVVRHVFQMVLEPGIMLSEGEAGIPLPYVEGLRMDEAMHPLAVYAWACTAKPFRSRTGCRCGWWCRGSMASKASNRL